MINLNFNAKIKLLLFKIQRKNKKFMRLEIRINKIKLHFNVLIILFNMLSINMITILYKESYKLVGFEFISLFYRVFVA